MSRSEQSRTRGAPPRGRAHVWWAIAALLSGVPGCAQPRRESPPDPSDPEPSTTAPEAAPPATIGTEGGDYQAPTRRTALVRLGPGASAAFVLRPRVDAEGWLERADVDIQDAGGRTLQTLTFRPECGPEFFRGDSYLADVNFDGYLDLVVPRELGAKFDRHDVWLFEPEQGRFVQSPLTKQLGRLPNLRVDADRKRIITYTIGPHEPSEVVFRVEKGRLELEESCRFVNFGAPTGTIVRKREGEGMQRTRTSIPLDANGEWASLPCVENFERLEAMNDARRSIPWRE